MIFAHAITGITLGNYFGGEWFWLAGSLAPDADHLFMLARHKILTWEKISQTMRFEEKYGLRYKTKYFHSILGALVISSPLLLLSYTGAFYFFLGYLLHLLFDWPDIDEKQYLYPFRKKFKGFLPIFSKPEKIFTVILALVMLISFWQ